MGRLRPLGDIFVELAQSTGLNDNALLSKIIKMAAVEAYDSNMLVQYELPTARPSIGLWDLDIKSDRNYTDEVCATLFGVDPIKASRGVLNSEFAAAIHPEDRDFVMSAVEHAISTGAKFECEYRLIDGKKIRWIYAKGFCAFDDSERPVRLSGTVVDITSTKEDAKSDVRTILRRPRPLGEAPRQPFPRSTSSDIRERRQVAKKK